MHIPATLRQHSTGERAEWLAALPSVLAEVADSWALTVGDPFEPGGQTSWVAPVARADGRPAVLKLLWPHYEAEHEAAALRVWAGNGAVELYDWQDLGHTRALLLERCSPGSSLSAASEDEQDEVLAGLLPLLWISPTNSLPFRHLSTMAGAWANECEDKLRGGARIDLEPSLVDQGLALFRSLAEPSAGDVLLATDLHAGNVLRAEREPWLAIDPKPYVGDPTYDAVQHVINCERMYVDPVALCRRFASLVGLDADRLMAWTFARCVVESPTWPELVPVARTLAGAVDVATPSGEAQSEIPDRASPKS